MIEGRYPGATAVAGNQSYSTSPLRGTRLWASRFLSDDEHQALDNAVSSLRRVKANTDLVREGERGNSLYIVTEGWAFRYTVTPEGGRQLPAIIVPGDIGNLDALLFDRLDFGVRTLTQATIVSLPRDRLLALADEHCGIARTFTWLALVENASLGKCALSLGRRSARERLAHFLCELDARLGGNEHGESSYEFPFTQEHIADVLGLTAVHVNRTMQALRAEGLLAKEGHIMLIRDVARLRQIGGFDPRYLHIQPLSVRQLFGQAS